MVIFPRIRLTAAVLYFFFISVLFCLPGSVFPNENWLSKIYFDKWVHVGFFAMLLLLWSWALMPGRKGVLWLLLSAVAYGLLVEVVQDQFVPNRALDLGDLAADIAGSLFGLWFWSRYIKNKPL
jgi:VanZ family protein